MTFQFETGARLYDGDGTIGGFGDSTGNRMATFRDSDGSLTNLAGSQIVKPFPFTFRPGCLYRNVWNMAFCPHKYGKVCSY